MLKPEKKKDVRGKVYLVTGGALGMGKEVAKLFAQDGAKIVLWDINEEALKKTKDEISALGTDVFTDVVNVVDRQAVYEAASKVKREVGMVDILHNNAGVVKGGYFLDVEDEWLFRTMDVNFNAYMWTTKAFLPDMVKRNQGHIINVASAAGLTYVPLLATYCASKAAVINFTDALRLEMKKLKKTGVKFTIICPSYVSTGMFAGVKAPPVTPWLTPEKMSQKIYEGFHLDKKIVSEPFPVKFTSFLRGITTRSGWDFISEATGANKSMNQWIGH
ncbi:MAG: SDR family oxidoreductase [Actinomycetota bacterium]|nr:SDR family oxidoreductase [Actinomycetota bacterium]